METALFTEENKIGLLIVSGIFIMFFMGIVLLLFFYFSKKKIIEKELEKKEAQLQHSKDLINATLTTQEKERKRIAQDLHDDISSKLNIVALNCHLLSMRDLTKEKEEELTGTIVNLSGKVLENSRRIAHNLFPPVFDKFGLNAAIEELCKEYNVLQNVTVKYQNNATFDGLHKESQMHIFRILQELINNSVRHGKASHISITFNNQNGTTCFYKDNGHGFDVEHAESKKGLGMKNIESRINFINGTIAVTSKINEGTSIIFSF
ncbi:sensor histidine kinase [Flavobacterium sp. Sd200]|uniref:sensor histidine kinase n=1 Tax=Flavobacterium sp. Sd200 TaxID=2692211 RepID=UPI00136AFAD4|nr:sensor histidine kinase [Flavobacterium sp. Sd200]MXN90789.1 sensor histidine kinase [Flavobacterium sp. Sd200]